METKKYNSVEEYFGDIPEVAKERMDTIRDLLKRTAPKAVETISYNMPTLKYRGVLLHYAAYPNHIGLYALPRAHADFKEELASYKQGKGSVQFPHDRPLPLELIQRMAAHRYREKLQAGD